MSKRRTFVVLALVSTIGLSIAVDRAFLRGTSPLKNPEIKDKSTSPTAHDTQTTTASAEKVDSPQTTGEIPRVVGTGSTVSRSENPAPANQYTDIATVERRTLVDQVKPVAQPILKETVDIVQKTKNAFAERGYITLQLSQFKLELTADGEQKLLKLADKASQFRVTRDGSICRQTLIISSFDSMLRARLHNGFKTGQQIRAAVAALGNPRFEELSVPDFPNLENKIIANNLVASDILPYLFYVQDVAADVKRGREQDAAIFKTLDLIELNTDKIFVMSLLFEIYMYPNFTIYSISHSENLPSSAKFVSQKSPSRRSKIFEDFEKRLPPGPYQPMPFDTNPFFPDRARDSVIPKPAKIRENQPEGWRSLDFVEVSKKFNLDSRFFNFPLPDRGSRELFAEKVEATNGWSECVQNELMPYACEHEQKIHKEIIDKLKDVFTKHDKAAIDNLVAAQKLQDEFELMFNSVIPELKHKINPIIHLDGRGMPTEKALPAIEVKVDPKEYVPNKYIKKVKVWLDAFRKQHMEYATIFSRDE